MLKLHSSVPQFIPLYQTAKCLGSQRLKSSTSMRAIYYKRSGVYSECFPIPTGDLLSSPSPCTAARRR